MPNRYEPVGGLVISQPILLSHRLTQRPIALVSIVLRDRDAALATRWREKYILCRVEAGGSGGIERLGQFLHLGEPRLGFGDPILGGKRRRLRIEVAAEQTGQLFVGRRLLEMSSHIPNRTIAV